MEGLSVVVNVVKEELGYLPTLFTSVTDIASEIVVVDMTGEKEIEVLREQFPKVRAYPHEFVNYVEPARNFGIENALGPWILVLDPDEEISSTLAKKLTEIIGKDSADYVRLPRKNIVFGKWLKHSRWWPDYNIRFFKKGTVSWNEVIHAVPMTTGRGADLDDRDEYAIVHHHYDSIEKYIGHLNRYTTIQAKLKAKSGYRFIWRDLIKKPVAEFLSRYYFGKGYRDGVHGLALSLLQAVSELVLYLKVWQAERFVPESLPLSEVSDVVKEAEEETHYWKADTEVNEGGGIMARVKRKFKLA